MFTGIVTDIGRVRAVAPAAAGRDARFEIAVGFAADTMAIGASIACAGVCLTVVERGRDFFAVDVSAETLAKTTLGSWRIGTAVDLERSLRVGDELGGHLVSGHIDGIGRVVGRREEGGSLRMDLAVSRDLGRFVAPKGSVAVDGASLTVNEVEDGADGATVFGVNLIPHTRHVTTLGSLQVGDAVNVEVDRMARYVARLRDAS